MIYCLIHPISNHTFDTMHEFENTIDKNHLKITNSLWNDLMLNDPWNVGHVTSLLESGSFARKEDWEEFYYESGKKRNRKIAELVPALCHKLNDDMLPLKNPNELRELSKATLNLNYYFGRTPEQLTEKAVILFQEALNRSIDVTIQECIEAARYRTLWQPWNQVAMRESHTIRILREFFPGCKFVSVKGDYDNPFLVDYEVYKEGILVCALRIKSESYMHLASANRNEQKKLHYSEKYAKPVFTLIAKSNGEIINTEVLSKMSLLVAEKYKKVFLQD